MPAIVDKIAEALHHPGHHKHSETKPADASSAPAEPASASAQPPQTSDAPKAKTPVFSSEKVTVLYVLGGPGAGGPCLF